MQVSARAACRRWNLTVEIDHTILLAAILFVDLGHVTLVLHATFGQIDSGSAEWDTCDA